MPKKGKSYRIETELVKSTTGSNWHFLIFENEVVTKLDFKDKFRRVLCSMNGAESFQCALMPWGDRFYIIVNKKKRESLGIEAGDMVDVFLVPDESQYGLPMPPEFREVLDQDTDGDQLFHALSPGKQRSLLYQLSKPKDIDVRIHQALVIVKHLKENAGNVVGEKLYKELKRPFI